MEIVLKTFPSQTKDFSKNQQVCGMNFEKKDLDSSPLNLAAKFDGKDALVYINFLELPLNQTKSIAKGSDNTYTRAPSTKSHL